MLPHQWDREGVPDIVRDILRRYLPEGHEESLKRIIDRSGIALEKLNKDNASVFLKYMEAELAQVTEEWKARFITGVIGQMISRADQ